MPDATIQDALAEAYAAAPTDRVILHTLELRHPAFVDNDGNPTAIRVVRDHQDLTARLEATAPLNGGEMVTFVRFAFEFTLPETSDGVTPELQLSLDNVSREIVAHVELALSTRDDIEVTYRPYLSTDLEGPQMDPPLTMKLGDVHADVFKVTGRARLSDLNNKTFPREMYTASRFPGLVR